jgi:hypothetical protein
MTRVLVNIHWRRRRAGSEHKQHQQRTGIGELSADWLRYHPGLFQHQIAMSIRYCPSPRYELHLNQRLRFLTMITSHSLSCDLQ